MIKINQLQKRSAKSVWIVLLLFCFLLGLINSLVPLGQSVPKAMASGDYSASGVLGQSNFTNSSSGGGATGLNNVYDVAIDGVNHHLYAADGNNNRVLVYNLNSDNSISDTTADYVLGQTNFTNVTCNTGGKTLSTLCLPKAVKVDTTNHLLYVADSTNTRVLIYTLNSSNVPTSNGQAASSSLGGSSCSTKATTYCDPKGYALENENHRQ